MHKNYNFQTAGTNSPLSWTVTIRSPDNINMKLSCANREIFGISKEGQARYYPLMSGEDIATGNTLTLELSSNKQSVWQDGTTAPCFIPTQSMRQQMRQQLSS